MTRLPKISGFALAKWFIRLYFNPLRSLQQVVNKVGKVVAFDGGKYQKLHFVSDPKFIKYILKTNKSNFKRAPVIKALRPLLGEGIFIAEDKAWQTQRSQLKPSFHDNIIRQYETVITDECTRMCKTWNHSHGLIDIEHQTEMLMLRILFQTQFGTDIDVNYKEIHRAHNEVLQQTSIRNQKITFYLNRFKKSIGVKPQQVKTSSAVKYLDTVARHVIAYGRSNRKKCSYWLADMLDKKMDDIQIRDQILNFIFAGYDTTASALTWTLYNLAVNKDVQDRCREEARQTKGLFSELSKLQYTKCCFQESIRLFPPVWSIHRQSVEADEIEGHEFTSGTYFMMCVYTLHQDPDFWENPSAFDPERFKGDNMRGKAFQYIPFGQGERVCIGQSLAIMESQIILSNVLRNFVLNYKGSNPPKITPGIIMKTKRGLLLDITPAA